MKADERTRRILDLALPDRPFRPMARYDKNGDCIEFFITSEPFTGHRLDKWVTVYTGRKSREVVGSFIKDVGKLLRAYPGLDIEIKGGKVLLSHILRAPAWSEGDPVKKQTYKAVIEKADKLKVTLDLVPA